MLESFEHANQIFTAKFIQYRDRDVVKNKNAVVNKVSDFFSDPAIGTNRAQQYYDKNIKNANGYALVKQIWVDILDMNERGINPLKGSIKFKKYLLEGVLDCFDVTKEDISERMSKTQFTILKSKEVLYFEAMVDLACEKINDYEQEQKLHIFSMENM